MRIEYNAVSGVKLLKAIVEKKVSLLFKLHDFYEQLALG